jgi:hypothetical protein
MTNQEIKDFFTQNNFVMVTFTKKDGTIRSMKCTRNLQLIPSEFHPKTDRKPPEDSLPVFDLEKQGWRSFRYDSILKIEGE